jgi:hypothetical protein
VLDARYLDRGEVLLASSQQQVLSVQQL